MAWAKVAEPHYHDTVGQRHEPQVTQIVTKGYSFSRAEVGTPIRDSLDMTFCPRTSQFASASASASGTRNLGDLSQYPISPHTTRSTAEI